MDPVTGDQVTIEVTVAVSMSMTGRMLVGTGALRAVATMPAWCCRRTPSPPLGDDPDQPA